MEETMEVNEHFSIISKIKTEPPLDIEEIGNACINMGNGYKCTMCLSYFDNENELIEHNQLHAEDPLHTQIHTCGFCNEIFSDRSHFDRHLFSHTKYKSHICDICSKGFTRREHKIRHLQTVHKLNKDLTEIGTRSDHQEPSTVDMANNRDEVSPFFFLQSIFADQKPPDQPSPDVERPILASSSHTCPFCAKELSRSDHLRRHIANIHSKPTNVETKLCCPICERFIPQGKPYEKHVRLHESNNAAKHQCTICHQNYSSRSNLKKHLLHTHNMLPPKGKSFTCRHCERKFIDSYYLRRHESTHEHSKNLSANNSNIVSVFKRDVFE